MVEVRWSQQALSDLDAIAEYLARTSPPYARALATRLFSATSALTDFPMMGRRVPEVDVEHVREIIRDGYRIVYLVTEHGVEILTVLHSRQDLARKLRRE